MATPVSGNNGYTSIQNTVVSASTILSAVKPAQMAQLVASGSVPLASTLAVTTANVALWETQFLQALNGLYVNASGLTAARSLTVGADTVANARGLQALFGLNTVGASVTLSFPYAAVGAAFALSLATTSATFANVGISLHGGAVAASQVLAAASATTTNGQNVVQLVATNVTSGSQAVTFNIIRAGFV
jgi:hypothetical protein